MDKIIEVVIVLPDVEHDHMVGAIEFFFGLTQMHETCS